MAIIRCKECGKEISSKSEKCPNCGAPLKSNVNVIGLIVGILLIFFSIGCFAGTSDDTSVVWTSTDGVKTVSSSDFSLLEEETTGTLSGDTYTISGKLKQNIEGSYNGLFIVFTVYDINGNELRNTSRYSAIKLLRR